MNVRRKAAMVVLIGAVILIADAISLRSADRVSGGAYAPLDDAYIHLQIFRNIVGGNGWGYFKIQLRTPLPEK